VGDARELLDNQKIDAKAQRRKVLLFGQLCNSDFPVLAPSRLCVNSLQALRQDIALARQYSIFFMPGE
jgi:hypothetical protein